MCFEDTRVKLIPLDTISKADKSEAKTIPTTFLSETDGNNVGHDYINASFIHGASGDIEYICSQAPVDDTIVDFWRMIFQEDVNIVLMLTPLVEQGRRKSSLYFPEKLKTSLKFKDQSSSLAVLVSCEECNIIMEGLTQRKFCLNLLNNETNIGSKIITHLHFIEWPDFSIGDENKLLSLIEIADSYKVPKKPTIVHCSAGIGRTGTYCTIDIVKNMISNKSIKDDEKKKIDISSIVLTLRDQRAGMVQTASQYELIYNIVIKWMKKNGYM